MALDPFSIERQFNTGALKPIYLFKGPEHFLHRYCIKKIEKKIKERGESFLKSVLMPDELEKGQLMDILNTTDLFASKKLLILFYPHLLRGKVQKDFLTYCSHPNLNNTLIIINDDFYKKTKFLISIEKLVKPLDMRTPFDSDLKKWATILFKEKNVKVGGDVVTQMVHLFGDSIYHLSNEVDKIYIGLKDSQSVTTHNIKKNAVWLKSYQNWEFLDVIARKKIKDALTKGRLFFEIAPDFSIIMNLFTSFFVGLYFYKISNGTFLSKIGSIPLAPYIKKRIPIGAKYYSVNEIENIIHLLTTYDRKLKTTSVSHESIFTKLLFYTIG